MPTFTIYPDDCDAYGHLNHAAFVRLFERARWEWVAGGPGMDVFAREGVAPVVRRASVEYLAPAYPRDVVRFDQRVAGFGRTSFTVRQTAHRTGDERLLAVAEFVLVCVNSDGRPVAIPPALRSMTNADLPGEGAARHTVNGVELAVEIRGEGPAVLFIHGYPLDRTIWADQLAHLQGWRRIAPDLRGFGDSDAPDLGYSMATWADDLVALLDQLGEEKVVLCGFSMGGYVAFEFLRRYRDRVSALVLVDTRAGADSDEGRRGRDQQVALAREHGAAAIAEAMVPKLLAEEASPEVRGAVDRIIRATPVAGIAGALVAMRDRPDSRPLLATLTELPTLVVVGTDDQLTSPDEAEAMADAIPDAVLVEIPGAGHLSPMEQPEAVTMAMTRFLEGLKS